MTQDEILRIVDQERRRRHMTRQQLEQASGISSETVRAWQYGKSSPTLSYLVPVLDALGLEVRVARKAGTVAKNATAGGGKSD